MTEQNPQISKTLELKVVPAEEILDTTRQNDEMVMILKNVMNDLYARDTSSKIRAVKRSSFRAGKYIGAYAPFGYQKSPDDKHVLVPDPASAPIVKRIFDLRCQGFGYRKIAAVLNGEKIPTPRDYYYLQAGNPNPRGETQFWSDMTVKAILRNEVYIGHTVQNKTGNVSYKVHKQISKLREEWIRVEDTHEPLISQEVWDAVQRLDNHPSKGRSGSDGEISMFAGVLYCMDCGTVMRFYHDGRKRKDGSKSAYRSYACSRYATGGKSVCTAHIMNERVLIEAVLADIRTKAALARNDPSGLVGQIQTQRRAATAEQVKQTRLLLTAIEKRLAELGKLIQAIYEDDISGAISHERFLKLSAEYEAEQRELEEKVKSEQQEVDTYEQNKSDFDSFSAIIRKYVGIKELTPTIVNEFIKKIIVHAPEKVDGKRVQKVDIIFNFVGEINFLSATPPKRQGA